MVEKIREGHTVIFSFNGVNQLGIVEDIKIVNKAKRYQCRAESGKLYPHLGVNTTEPGKIEVALTKLYFEAKEKAGETVKVLPGTPLYHLFPGDELETQ